VPKASIVVPTRGRPTLLSGLLESLAFQDSEPGATELIIVDNAAAPTAAAHALTGAAGPLHVRYVHEPRAGLHHARHAGARAAAGAIVLYVDDDVLCSPGWLRAMVSPFSDPSVGMVGGRVRLRFEGEPPAWVRVFPGMLSALDWGDEPRATPPYWSPVGCNMAVRREALFDVGGFNPDGFGDPGLLHLRGDGECGLARKLHDAGWVVWYAPDAWLEHRVPPARLEPAYLFRRHTSAGIEAAYTRLRYGRASLPRLLGLSTYAAAFAAAHAMVGRLSPRGSERHVRHCAVARLHASAARQHVRQLLSRELREHTLRASYLDP
jgi:glucosyl-dolichyl phosphate glucuronosyltransferase